MRPSCLTALSVVLVGIACSDQGWTQDVDVVKANAAEASQTLKIFSLKHAPAEEMQRILFEVLLDQSPPTHLKSRPPLRVSSDVRTNSLILRGDPSTLEIAEALMARLDVEVSQSSKKQPATDDLLERVQKLEKEVARLRSLSRPAVRTPQQKPKTSDGAAQRTLPLPTEATAVRVERSGAIEWIIANGQVVKKGDVLARLGKTESAADLAKQEVVVAQLNSRKHAAQHGHRQAAARVESEILQAELGVRNAELAMKAFDEGERLLNAKELAAEISNAEFVLSKAAAESEARGDKGFELQKSKIALDIAKMRQEVFQKFSVPKQKLVLQGQLETAVHKLEQIKADSRDRFSNAEANAEATEMEFKAAVQRLEELRKAAAPLEVKAPHPGVVFLSRPLPNNSLVRAGQTILFVKPAKP